jgi:hypothetical protein
MLRRWFTLCTAFCRLESMSINVCAMVHRWLGPMAAPLALPPIWEARSLAADEHSAPGNHRLRPDHLQTIHARLGLRKIVRRNLWMCAVRDVVFEVFR